ALRRLGPLSRAQRCGGPKPRVPARELELLARVDGRRHALVAWVDGDPEPAALAQLVRAGTASTLAAALAAAALAAGITELRATVTGDNPRVVSLLRRVTGSVRETW